MVRRRGRTTSSEQGQALVEFALVLPVFLLLIFGVVEFGVAYNAATSVNFGDPSYSEPPAPKRFIADHPFLFFLRDTTTARILFMGRVVNPKN